MSEAQTTNYCLGRIRDYHCPINNKIELYFLPNFDINYFATLLSDVQCLPFDNKNIYHLSTDEILTAFGQLEKIMWYYNDHLKFNRYKIVNLYSLIKIIFPKLANEDLKYLTNKYNNIVQELPVAGIILISNGHVLLVQHNFSKKWSYPKGKIEKKETPLLAAIRECYEEIGYDASHLIKENRLIIKKYDKYDKLGYFFVVTDVPFDYPFKPQSSYEILDAQWFPLDDMFNKRRDFNMYIRHTYNDLLRLLKSEN